MPYKTWLMLGGAVALIFLSLTAVEAEVVTQTVEYRQDGTVMRGFLAYDDGLKGKRPGVLVVHEWWGLNDFARERALKLAGLGYVALAADMYGDGVITSDPKEAGKLAGALLGNPACFGPGPRRPSRSWRLIPGWTPNAWRPSASVSGAPRSWNWPTPGRTWPGW